MAKFSGGPEAEPCEKRRRSLTKTCGWIFIMETCWGVALEEIGFRYTCLPPSLAGKPDRTHTGAFGERTGHLNSPRQPGPPEPPANLCRGRVHVLPPPQFDGTKKWVLIADTNNGRPSGATFNGPISNLRSWLSASLVSFCRRVNLGMSVLSANLPSQFFRHPEPPTARAKLLAISPRQRRFQNARPPTKNRNAFMGETLDRGLRNSNGSKAAFWRGPKHPGVSPRGKV